MTVLTYQWRNDPGETSLRPRQLFVCDTSAEKPVTGLLEGDMAYAKDNDTLYIADSATTWDAFAGGGGGASTLDDLTDVVITSPADDHFLRHNGTNWVNEAVSLPTGDVATDTIWGCKGRPRRWDRSEHLLGGDSLRCARSADLVRGERLL